MATTPGQRTIATPTVYPDTEHFWNKASEGVLALKRCTDCGKPHHFPRTICPFCGSDRTEWTEAKGRGTIYSVSVTRRGPGAPYAIAYVTLDEGVTMLTNIVDCDLDSVRIDDPVEVVFVAAESGQAVPMFRPVHGAGATSG